MLHNIKCTVATLVYDNVISKWPGRLFIFCSHLWRNFMLKFGIPFESSINILIGHYLKSWISQMGTLIYILHLCCWFLSRPRLIPSVCYQAIIQSILISGRLGPNVQNASCFGLRLKHLKSEEHHWLHPDLTVGEVEQRYEKLHLEAEWRWEAMLNTYTTLIYET